MTFGKKVKQRRLNENYSQSYLSKLTGIPQTTISDIENDLYTPNVLNAKKIADILNCTVEDLLEDEIELYRT